MFEERIARKIGIVGDGFNRLFQSLLPDEAQIERVLAALLADVEVFVKGVTIHPSIFLGSYHLIDAHCLPLGVNDQGANCVP